jgi:hypothetical protein
VANVVIETKTANITMNGTAFMVYGKRYREAAEVWRRTAKSDRRFDPVSYQLLCQSLELHLKSFIWLKDGVGNDVMKKRYGHDIAKLWKDAKAKGISKFAKVTPRRDSAIELLSPYYRKRQFNYLDIDMIFRGFREIDREPHALQTMMQLTKQLGASLREPILRAS